MVRPMEPLSQSRGAAEQDAETKIVQAESQAHSKIVGEEQKVSRELAQARVVIAEEQAKVKNGIQLLVS